MRRFFRFFTLAIISVGCSGSTGSDSNPARSGASNDAGTSSTAEGGVVGLAGGNGGAPTGTAGGYGGAPTGTAGGYGGAPTSTAGGRGGALTSTAGGQIGSGGIVSSLLRTTGHWGSVQVPFTGLVPELTLTKLRDGSVLTVGSGTQVFRYLPSSNTLIAAKDLTEARTYAAATLLADGRVLVVGGHSSNTVPQATCVIYNPTDDSWTPTTSLPAPRSLPAAITLADGNVLVAGGAGPGVGGTPAGDVYRYVVATGEWQPLSSLAQPCRFPTIFMLSNQAAMVAGENPQVYDLAAQSVTASPALSKVRRYAATVQLPNANVLSVGGIPLTSITETTVPYNTVDEYASGATKWTARASMSVPRSDAGAVTLRDGTVFVAGGIGTYASTGTDPAARTAERYIPSLDSWSVEASPPTAVGKPAILLDDGSVFFVNGARFYPVNWL